MTTFKQKAEFVGQLSGSAIEAGKQTERNEARAKAMQEVLGDGLLPTERDELREAMTFKVKTKDGKGEVQSMDERGQRKSIETEDVRTRYQSIDPKDYARVQAALEKIVKMKEKLLAAKDSGGKALFDSADLMTELYAPLVREGLMPENLVIDDHSETAQLLKKTYESYLNMLEEARQARKEKDAKATVDLHGGGTKLDKLKAFGTRAQNIVEENLGVIADKAGLTNDELKRLGSMSMTGLMTTYSAYNVGPASGNLANAVNDTVKVKNVTELGLTGDTAKVLKSGIKDGIGIATTSKDHLDSQKSGAKENRNTQLTQAAMAAAVRIDQAVSNELVHAYPPAMGSLEGRIAKGITPGDLVEAVLVEKPQAATMTGLVTTALQSALSGVVSSDEARKAFGEAASKLCDEYGSRVDVGALIDGLDFSTHPVDDAFEPLVAAAGPAAKAVFAGKDFKEAARAAQLELVDAAALNNESLTDQLQLAQDEAEEFERQLVLVDEGGEDMARQQSIAVLIGQLEKDRLDLEIVNKVGSVLGGFGGSVAKLGVDARNFDLGKVTGTLATEVGQSLIPALKAAQLVMQMSVNIIQIARRAEIAAKFKKDVDKARKAGNALLPAVENFYSAKVAQQTFASIELALQTVQLAGAICSSVPEPITQATGRLLTAIGTLGSSANELAEQVYTDTQLDKGWERTLQALNNPANRRAGLDALRSNGTLAIHAIAWAATQKGDAIAKEILNSCGVDALTLADSASDQKAVVAYLETRLHEDIQFKDKGKIDTQWAPSPLVLSYPGWFAIINRAVKDATPRLAYTPIKELQSALRALDLQPRPETLVGKLDDCTEQQLETWVSTAEKVKLQLRAYKPVTADNQPHTDMLHIRSTLADLADDREQSLRKQLAQKRQMAVQI